MPRPKKNKLPQLVPDTPSAQLLAEKPKTPLSAIAKKKAELFDDSDSDAEFHSAVQSPADGAFKVNQDYARRFEHNKKREELHRLEEKYGKDAAATKSRKRGRDEDDISGSDSDDSSSEDEDEVAVLATETLDQQIMATIEAIRKKDPRVYDKSAQFYDPIDVPAGEAAAQKKEKPMFLRDYHRENLLAGHTGGEDEDSAPTFVQQQEELKRTVVKEMHAAVDEEDDDEDAFMVRKEKPQKEKDTVTDIPDPSTADPENPDEYLSKFLASRAWAKASGSGYVPIEDDDTDSDVAADEFEYNYNMRFEDPDAAARAKLATYSRDAVNTQSVRREEKSKRKRAREEKRKRKEEEKAQRDEEKRRLKKLKTEEMMEKFKKVREAAGLEQVDEETQAELFHKLLEDDFSDGEWEQWMQERFNDEYYGAKDPMKKPEFDDDIDITDIVPDFSDDAAGEDDEEDEENEGAEPVEEEAEEDDEAPEHRPQKRKTKKDLIREKQERKQKDKQLRRRLERFVDDNFDVDDKIGGAKTSGFRYRETTPETYGLTPLDILAAPDAELNSFAGLKKYAAFRDPEKKERDRKRLGKKKRLKQWRKDVFGDPQGVTMPADWKPEGLVTKTDAKEGEQSNIIEADGERKKKRRKKNKSKV
ncbi:Krr1-domain-containing protein [Ascodesmis nigricans]|uniref:Krr1-domain-containing protein n=1 Tax=Ascodesmis nigricans TaxID=341454 RepID=A0A4S2MZI2_9PEZI|nr:Krr1-domain-containing protein [Ascodesmis nigricans]